MEVASSVFSRDMGLVSRIIAQTVIGLVILCYCWDSRRTEHSQFFSSLS